MEFKSEIRFWWKEGENFFDENKRKVYRILSKLAYLKNMRNGISFDILTISETKLDTNILDDEMNILVAKFHMVGVFFFIIMNN